MFPIRFAIALVAGLLLISSNSGCVRAPIKEALSSAEVDFLSKSKDLLTIPNPPLDTASDTTYVTPKFPYPGPFNLVVKDGREYWQARGELGKFGGTLTLSSFGGGPKTFNPWVAADAESHGLGYLLFDPLVDTDVWTGQVYPKLARAFHVSADNKEYTFTLRKGLVWSDGKPITADDVVFTFGKLVAGGYGNASARDSLSAWGHYPSVEKVDELTVRFKTKVPFAPFLHSLTAVPVAPRHILEPVIRRGGKEFFAFWDINAAPKSFVVSGPFKLLRYLNGQRVELDRNPHYAMLDRRGRQMPYLSKLNYVIVPDQNTQALKFYNGEIDLLDVRSVRGIDAAKMKSRAASLGYTMFNLGPDDGTMMLMFNMNRRTNGKTGKSYVAPVKQEWFNNVYFRQAVSHAIDRQAIVDNVLRGVGLPLYTAESSASMFYNRDLRQYPQDLDLARQLLKKGGFVTKAGTLYDQEGHRVEFTLNTNAGNTNRDAVCIMLVHDLSKLGIKVNYQQLEFNTLVDKIDHSFDWEAIVIGLTGGKLEPYEGANVWKTDGRLHMFDLRKADDDLKVRVKDERPWESQISRLFDQAATTFDIIERKRLFCEYQKIVYEQQPFIYLYSSLNITAARNRIGNYRPMPLVIYYTPKGTLHNIEEIFLKDAPDKLSSSSGVSS